eukprot:TRINITY_DN69513_c0_g1_i1.p3 TRINITY_DN69513_c0_g1~~TRINITY_DN69513_c0_g1_i1.p3  ORF type:complete len:143 (-),score=24.50 TRINITY_DN69513_c0_g1_i1:245-673(-)
MHEKKDLTLGDREFDGQHLFDTRGAPEDPSAVIVGDKMKLSAVGPILEFATFKPGAKQTMHTHPTGRAVVMVSGSGTFEWFDGKEQRFEAMSVRKGMVFGFEPDVPHAFNVDPASDEPLVIFAFQTDADTVNYAWSQDGEEA